jgi:hypothetical protein
MEMEMEMMMPFSIVVTGRRCVCLLSFQHCYLFCSHHHSNLFFFTRLVAILIMTQSVGFLLTWSERFLSLIICVELAVCIFGCNT